VSAPSKQTREHIQNLPKAWSVQEAKSFERGSKQNQPPRAPNPTVGHLKTQNVSSEEHQNLEFYLLSTIAAVN
jgi:hypothetical protein